MVAESVAAKIFKIGSVVFELWPFYNNYRLCCVMENTEIWLADKRVKISAISTWMSFWIRMNVILTRNAGTTNVLPGETRIHSSRIEPEKTIDSKSIKTFHCLTERWYVAIIACCDVPRPCLLQ